MHTASCQTSGFDCANNSPSYDPATDYPTATCASTSCTAEECCATTLGDFDACQGEECNQRSVESSPNKWIDIVVGFGGDYVTRTPPPGTFVQSSDDWFPIFDVGCHNAMPHVHVVGLRRGMIGSLFVLVASADL